MLEGAENRVALLAGPGAERLLLQTLGQVILSLWKTEWAGNQEKGQEMWAWERVWEIWEGSGNLRRGWKNLDLGNSSGNLEMGLGKHRSRKGFKENLGRVRKSGKGQEIWEGVGETWIWGRV